MGSSRTVNLISLPLPNKSPPAMAKAMKAMKAMKKKAAMKAMKAMKKKAAMKAMKVMKKKAAMKAMKAMKKKSVSKIAQGRYAKVMTKNKNGRVVSKKQSAMGKKPPWIQACTKARKALKITGFAVIKKGTPLYAKAKEFYNA